MLSWGLQTVQKQEARCNAKPQCSIFPQSRLKVTEDSEIWFICQKLGVHSLSSLMRKMAQSLGLKGKFTNHSARSFSLNQLIHSGVPPVMVAQLPGHKDVSSVMTYPVANTDQQAAMSNILQAEKLPSTRSIAATGIQTLPCKNTLCHLLNVLKPKFKPSLMGVVGLWLQISQ